MTLTQQINIKDYVISIEFTGSQICGAIVDTYSNRIVPGSLIKLPISDGFETQTEQHFADMVRHLKSIASVSSKIVVTASKHSAGHKFVEKEDILNKMLNSKFGKGVSMFTINDDAELFLRGEVSGGAAVGFNKVIGVRIGETLDTSRFRDGKYQNAGLESIAFKDGVANGYISNAGLINIYNDLAGTNHKTIDAIFCRPDADEFKLAAFNIFAKHLAQFLQYFIEEDNPDIVVLGGTLLKHYALFAKELWKQLRHHLTATVLTTAHLGEHANIIGAALSV